MVELLNCENDLEIVEKMRWKTVNDAVGGTWEEQENEWVTQ